MQKKPTWLRLKCDCGTRYDLHNDETHEKTQAVMKKYGVKTLGELQGVYKCIRCTRLGTKTVTKKEPVQKPKKFQNGKLIGYEQYIKSIDFLQGNGTKAVFIAGFHGLGKSTMVEEVAKANKGELIRFQMTETTSECDIVGGLDLKSGEFRYSVFVEKLLEAKECPEKNYYVLIDEFTRGRDEALNVLFPFLAERKLVINSAYAKDSEILVGDNVKVFATGNLHDSGQRDVGQAELDRYNVIEVHPIDNRVVLNRILKNAGGLEDNELKRMLIDFYLLTWKEHREARIIAMSIRTLIECGKLVANMKPNTSRVARLKKALSFTYYGTSHAVLNPNYKRTYEELIGTIVDRSEGGEL